MTDSSDTRPLPERGQQHFEWLPDEPIERAIAGAEVAYGRRGKAIQAVWAAARRQPATAAVTLSDGRAIEVYPHPRVPEWHIVVELVEHEATAEAEGAK